jgi:two-component system, LuxR family, sensor histidine kinase DctS
VRDTLWVERALQFQIGADSETLQRLADDLGGRQADDARFEAQARQLLTSDPAIVAIEWRDAAGAIKLALAQHGAAASAPTDDAELALREAMRAGRLTSALTPTRPFALADGSAFAAVAQIPGKAREGEIVAATISLDRMLNQNIPWWIAEKRAVEIRDLEGHLLAARTHGAVDKQSLGHTIAFGEKPAGLLITLFPAQSPTNLTRDGLVGAIVILGLLAVGGLLARENHLRKRRVAEAELRSEHAFRKAMEDSLTVGMRARDRDGRVIYVNQAFCRMMGWTREELVGRAPPMPYWLPEEMERTKAFHDKVLSGAPPADGVELAFQRRDGARLVALVQEAPLIGIDGRQSGWMGSFLDITERKAAEALARQQADQLEAKSRQVLIGEMASILAHDLNQPLATITGYQAGLMNRLADGSIAPDEVARVLAKLGDAAQRAGQIIHRVQDVVKRNEPRFERVNVGELVARTLTIFQNEPRPAATRIALESQPDAFVERCDDVLIAQVLINLLLNAEEAMCGLPRHKRRIDVSVTAADASVEVQIADRGPGLPPEMAGEIFRPFVSTKQGGMGLGLTICRSVLEAHRSRLTCSPRAGGGSVFKFRLAGSTP